MIHVSSRLPGGSVPEVLTTTSGQPMATVKGPEGAQHLVRMLSYLPGCPLALTRPHSPALLRGIGELLGRLDMALQDFSHAAQNRELKWDLKHGARVTREFADAVQDPVKRALLDRWLQRLDASLFPRMSTLRSSLIHNDASDHNLLVESTLEEQRVVGIIDFGDMVHTYTLGEPAIAIAYVMLDKPAPLAAAAQVVGGYHAVFPVPESELPLLFDLACMRLCASVTIAARQCAREPENEYLAISNVPAWRLLEKLEEVPSALAHYTFRQACGLPVTPAATNPESDSLSTGFHGSLTVTRN